MSLLSPRLQLKLAQKQILTPSLLQMVTVLQLNRLELKEMINQEIVKNPVLEESSEDAGEEVTPEELLPILEAEAVTDPADKQILDAAALSMNGLNGDGNGVGDTINGNMFPDAEETAAAVVEPEIAATPLTETPSTDPFDEIDFGSYFDDYLDPGYKSPASESIEKPSFETFLSSPVTLSTHLAEQLALMVLTEPVRDAADVIVGNLDENGYLNETLAELASAGEHKPEDLETALSAVQSCDPAGVGARDPKECLFFQIESRSGKYGVVWEIIANHMKLLETRQFKELAKVMGRPAE